MAADVIVITAISVLLLVVAVSMDVQFHRRSGRSEAVATLPRVGAVALWTFVAAVIAPFAAAVINGRWVGCACADDGTSIYSHPSWHVFWAFLMVAVAFGVFRFRRALRMTGSTARSLLGAQLLALAAAAGNVLAATAAAGFTGPASFVHNVGEFIALGCTLLLVFAVALAAASAEEGDRAQLS